MNKIRTIIIDDERKASENIEILIQNYCKEVEVVGIYNHPLEALEGIKELKPDLLFLDVEMPQFDGFQLLELLPSTIDLKVIFTTAYKDYAFNAIKNSASDFLLKPIDIKELISSVNKVSSQLNATKSLEPEKSQLIKIASINGFDLININDINYLKSDNNATEIFYMLDGIPKRVIATKSIKYFEDTLQGYSFFRIHDSFLVNLNKIKQYIKGEGGNIIMLDGTEIDVSRRRKQDFLNQFLN
jgi:two-component system LytT family response regulator